MKILQLPSHHHFDSKGSVVGISQVAQHGESTLESSRRQTVIGLNRRQKVHKQTCAPWNSNVNGNSRIKVSGANKIWSSILRLGVVKDIKVRLAKDQTYRCEY